MEEYSTKTGSLKALIFPPHLTIVSRFKTEKYHEFLARFKKECKNFSPLELETENIFSLEDTGLVALRFKDDAELSRIHQKMLELASEFKEPWVRDKLLAVSMNDRQKELVDRYGSPFVLEYYHPHLSLTGADVDRQKVKNLNLPLPYKLKLTMNVLHIMRRTGDEWTLDHEESFPNKKLKKES